MSVLTLIAIVVALVVAVLLALALAWLPMRLLLGRMARDISNFIERQRERRRVERGTPDRRHM
jgi:uncharacterized protein HemY